MPDREKVIADLRGFINYPEPLSGTIKDALELLKEQEPINPIRHENWWECPSCGRNIFVNMKYCYGCGKNFKWDGYAEGR